MATKINDTLYRSQVLISDPGKPRKYKSFYGKTADEADFNALAFKLGKTKQPKEADRLTVAQAVEKYIDLRRPVLSPATICGYEQIKRNNLDGIGEKTAKDIEYTDIQQLANELSATHSVKTAKNVIGLVLPALRIYTGKRFDEDRKSVV